MSIQNRVPHSMRLFTDIDVKHKYVKLYKKITQEDNFNEAETLEDKFMYILSINNIQIKQNLINGLKFKYEYELKTEKDLNKLDEYESLQRDVYDFENKYSEKLYFKYKCNECDKLGFKTKDDVISHYRGAHNKKKTKSEIQSWLIKGNDIEDTYIAGYKDVHKIIEDIKIMKKNKIEEMNIKSINKEISVIELKFKNGYYNKEQLERLKNIFV